MTIQEIIYTVVLAASQVSTLMITDCAMTKTLEKAGQTVQMDIISQEFMVEISTSFAVVKWFQVMRS